MRIILKYFSRVAPSGRVDPSTSEVRPRPIPLIPVLSAFLIIAFSSAAHAGESCPQAQKSLTEGNYLKALDEADLCIKSNPGDMTSVMLKTRALAALRKYDEALALISKALERYPKDADWMMMRIRILVWKGEIETAWAEIQSIPPEAFNDPEATSLAGDLAWRKGDCRSAVIWYTRTLKVTPEDTNALSHRGACLDQVGDLDGAEADFKKLCARQVNCARLDDIQRRNSRYRLLIQPSYAIVIDRPDEWDVLGLFEARVWDQLKLGISADFRTRYYDTPVNDTYTQIFGSYRWKNGFMLNMAGGFTIHPQFSPVWTAAAEAGYAFKFGLETYLGYTRYQFKDTAANVVTPSLTYSIGSFALTGKYFLSIDDSGNVTSAAFAKMTYFLKELMAFYAGAGGGNHADYLDVPSSFTQSYWTVFAGMWWNVTWQHRILLGYTWRDETADNKTYLQNYIIVGYQYQF